MKNLSFLFLITLTACSQPADNSNNSTVGPAPAPLDTAVFVVIPFDTSMHRVFENAKATTLKETELRLLDKMFNECLEEYNANMRAEMEKNRSAPDFKEDDYLLIPARYKRQYLPVVNENGEVEVWVNSSCGEWDERYRSGIVIVKDGGNCYFNFKANLTTGKCSEMFVNGGSLNSSVFSNYS